MRNLIIYLSALGSLSQATSMRTAASQFQDLLAFPKYQVQFLNHLPLSKSEAAQCQSAGLDEEDQFLECHIHLSDTKTLGETEGSEERERLTLMPMNLGSPNSAHGTQSYLCLLPSSNTTSSQTKKEDEVVDHEVEPDPLESWQALNHLEGQCLYSKQGWFTYSYCHNSHIRQFREARHSHPHPPSGYVPEEDPTFDAYTLGQAQSSPKTKASSLPGRPHADPPHHTPHKSISFGSNSAESSRYLVQRWSDGTRCDKSGRPREIEIQVHCSMTTTDIIYLVKELAICQYVIIIHSPHLCSLPGFRAEHRDVQSAPVRCRKVLPDEEYEKWERENDHDALRLPFSDKPKGMEQPRKSLPPVIPVHLPVEMVLEAPADGDLKTLLQQALDLIQNNGKSEGGEDDDLGDGLRAKDVILLSWDEGVDGEAVLLEEGGSGSEVEGVVDFKDKETLLKVMKAYLERRERDANEKEEDRVRDEL